MARRSRGAGGGGVQPSSPCVLRGVATCAFCTTRFNVANATRSIRFSSRNTGSITRSSRIRSVYRIDERHRDGRRHGYFARRASHRRFARRHRFDPDGDAGDAYRTVPDVGASWFLARTPGAAGRYLAVTGGDDRRRRWRYTRALPTCISTTRALPALHAALRTEAFDTAADVLACVHPRGCPAKRTRRGSTQRRWLKPER